MAVLKGMMKVMLERELAVPGTVVDHRFIADFTVGYEAFVASLETTQWGDILSESGLTRDQITEAAQMFMSAERVITCWAMGLTQHKTSVATIQDVVNLHLLRGQVGKSGAGVCPVRGHSNVQGDRTMGIWEKVNEKFFGRLEEEFGIALPKRDGFNTVESIEAMRDGRAKIFFAMGGNFASASPDTEVVFEALQRCRLTVQVITKLNRTALSVGEQSLILPCLGRSEIDMQKGGEQFVTTESTMLNVQMSKGIFEPASENLRSEPSIIAELAKATLGTRSMIDWDALAADYDRIRDSISRVIDGCENYNDKVREPGGFYLNNPPRDRVFLTPTGKAQFIPTVLEKISLESGQLLLTTIRSHNQFNTTIYGFDDRYRGVAGERRVVFMNNDDIAERALQAGQVVDLTSHFDDGVRHAERFIVVPYPIPRGCAAAYFPEANPLVPLGSKARRSDTPTSKSIVISVRAREEFVGSFEYDHSIVPTRAY
jgi:molybdopterin-dependent oxidoreductase alpha subunit